MLQQVTIYLLRSTKPTAEVMELLQATAPRRRQGSVNLPRPSPAR
ncbi:hypothetical protein XCR_3085 [Xanthomonas campestris pv. raphani 756C]|nr:hypothetical protein XCR_3085 [Xanthomonas campestris pv. raphani 756C]